MKVTGKFVVTALAVLFAAAATMILHALLPAGVDAEQLDGALVKLLGFPLVAVSYFLLLFVHSAVVVRCFGGQASMTRLQIGLRFGLAFAILYLVGMQEVLIEASPFEEWGLAFVKYQFFMGVGDAIPAVLLCVAIALFTLGKTNASAYVPSLTRKDKLLVISATAIAFLAARTIGYVTGIISSDCGAYAVPCYIWTAVFGVALGCSYVILFPVFARERNRFRLSAKLVVLTIGVSWVMFNSFIGLVFSGYMPQCF